MSQLKSASLISYTTIIINILIGLVLTPFILKFLGKSEYGIYMLVGSIVGYLALFDFGLNNATIRFISKYRYQNDKKSETSYIATNILLYLGIALLIVIVGLIGFLFIDDVFLNKFSENELYSFKAMYLFMIPGGILQLRIKRLTELIELGKKIQFLLIELPVRDL